MSDTKGKFLGVALIARRVCGRMTAFAWADSMDEASIRRFENEAWSAGETVERSQRFALDTWPASVCLKNELCACKPPRSADFGVGPEPITLSAQPLGQEDTMNDNPTAATIRAAHSNMEAIIAAVIRDQIRIFERETGLEVHGVDVQLATLTSVDGRETLVDSVDVRVGLGR